MNICVIGLGLLGGSFALGLKEKHPNFKFIGVEADAANAQKALELGIVDEIQSLGMAVKQADFTVLATPVNIIYNLLPPILDLLPTQATLIDLGSTKEQICSIVVEHPKRGQFVAMHPIAGTEYSGPEAAFSSLLNDKTMIICEKEMSNPVSLSMAEQLCLDLQMNLRYMNAADHDLQLAYVSHLSHISSFALGITVLNKEADDQNIFDMAGSGFSSTVRLAKSSPTMWAPIFTQNKKNVSEALGNYIKLLQQFKASIDNEDETTSKELMLRANDIRRILG